MKRPIKDQPQVSSRISRRALIMGAAQFGMVGVLGWRMRSMQVEHADLYRNLAEENRVNLRLIAPSRGLIYDRAGVPLAVNEQVYRINIVPEEAGDIDDTLRRLTDLVEIPEEDIARTREECERQKMRGAAFVPVTIVERVAWDDVARVTVNAPALPGISAEVGLSRLYPQGADSAHVVGYVGPVSDYDLRNIPDPDPLLEIPRFQIGKTGVEAKFEEMLRGEAGTKQLEVNAAGRVMRELGREEGVPGADLQLTIDTRLQRYTEARLEGESAAVVVIDLESGDLRAVASAPTFDPNLFVRGISVADWTGLNENIYRPLSAKTVQGAYPPGSTFKMVVALAALEAGVVSPDETVYCPGYTEVGGTRFHCWKSWGHGNVDMHRSLQESCDCYYYEIGQRVGIDRIAAMARKLGVGIRHDVPMSAESVGIAPDRAWKRERYDEDWRIGDTVNASIGQGYVLATPLQLAVMCARVATGRDIRPRLVQSVNGIPEPSGAGESLGLNENFLRRVRAGMHDVSNNPHGTGYGSRTLLDEAILAGKSGTSQVRRITPEERARGVTSNEDLPWERRDHALWVNFAPYDKPRFAVACVVEHGGGGSSVAAPIARDVTLQALYDGPPPLEAYPSNQRGRIAELQSRIAGQTARAAAQRSDRA
ncbi:penicillin-binding protein 2 [Pseudoroseicyclus aestuarii]|uniref:Penicillin-binding protein 2 n=1 Tax=Pseudoroseicyclus aestuarii TaxID=1795041 RepID=A0A318SPE6_9RHOB|nr:penicillin-binding protein 2 [Pseudoroseicyclus aestuarii]PYE83751.1 penicillin-binding protein 2 [Pseudoroseicyclus aestuarii]